MNSSQEGFLKLYSYEAAGTAPPEPIVTSSSCGFLFVGLMNVKNDTSLEAKKDVCWMSLRINEATFSKLDTS